MEHSLDIRVYYEDTDAAGIVFYANYLKFAERGRTEWLRDLGYQNSTLKETEGLVFVVHRINAEYASPAKLDDLLQLKTAVKTVRKTGFTMAQTLYRGDDVLFKMDVELVCVNDNGRPTRIPEEIEQKMRG